MEIREDLFSKYGNFADSLMDKCTYGLINDEKCTVIKLDDMIDLLNKHFPVGLPNANFKADNGWFDTNDILPEEPVEDEKFFDDDYPWYLERYCKLYLVIIKNAKMPTFLYYIGKGKWFDEETWQEYQVSYWQEMPVIPRQR